MSARQDIVVMKFGGTSVEDSAAMLRTAKIVAGRVAKGLKPIVVVSAMSKVTDTLLAAADAAGRNAREEALKLSDALRTRHLKTASELTTGDRLTSLQQSLARVVFLINDRLDDLGKTIDDIFLLFTKRGLI